MQITGSGGVVLTQSCLLVFSGYDGIVYGMKPVHDGETQTPNKFHNFPWHEVTVGMYHFIAGWHTGQELWIEHKARGMELGLYHPGLIHTPVIMIQRAVRNTRRKMKMLWFATALHARLGFASPARVIDDTVARMIYNFL